jgi:glycosyltransferase involved in cell wall biosynthesis
MRLEEAKHIGFLLNKFTGNKTTPEDYMSRAGIYVLSSRCEGFPNVLLEAMAMGAPVISSNCKSGPTDIITEGHNGLIFNVDDITGLSKAIIRLVKDVNLRKAFSDNSFNIKNDYNIKKIMLEWEKIL